MDYREQKEQYGIHNARGSDGPCECDDCQDYRKRWGEHLLSAGSDLSGTYEWPILRPCTAWASCSTIGCDHDAKSNVLHQPDDAPPIYVPFCDECIDARQGGAVIEYQMTVSGFIGRP